MNQEQILESLVSAAKENRLAAVLNERIRKAEQKGVSSETMVKKMADSAGVQPGTVKMILRGKIKRPPEKRLGAFSVVLEQLI